MKGWQSLYVHRKQNLFLEVYVGDFHMAGRAENLAPMWAKLRKVIDLDPPVPFHENTYLGCTQRDIEVPQDLVD